MSSSGTPHHTARHRSGRCVMATPTSSPPLDRPSTASRSREARPLATSQSAPAWKSSNTFCLLARRPAWCQASPSSMPPRSPAMANAPPAAHHAAICGDHTGVSAMANPP